jgi:hypothetical protein
MAVSSVASVKRGGGWVALPLTSTSLAQMRSFFLQRRQVRTFLVALRLFAVNGEPARRHQHLALGLEGFLLDPRDARGDVVLGGRIEDGEEAFGDQVVDLLFRLGQALWRGPGGDDGKVIAHLGVVEDALVGVHPAVLQYRAGKRGVGRAGHRRQGFLDRADIVFGQVAAVGTRIGQDLVLFVERLGQPQGVLGTETEAAVGLALQRGEVVEHRAGLGLGLALFFHRAVLAEAGLADRIGPGLVPEALGPGVLILGLFEFLIEPAPAVAAGDALEFALDFPVVARDKGADAGFALDHDGQGRGLHAADRGLVEAAFLGIEGGHGAGAVDADQPVGFRAAARGVRQGLHFLVRAQMGKAVADGGRGHRLQPEAAHRLLLFAQRVLRDVAEDQFAFAARVAGVDQAGDVLALDQPGQQLEPVLGLLDGIEREMRRNHRQMGEAPLAALDVVFLRHGQFQQVADRRRQYVVVIFEVVAGARETAQSLGNVLRHRGLFGDDELL